MLEEVFIIGGGPSLVKFDMENLTSKTTIAVNKAAFFLPNPTYFVTMDYSFVRKAGRSRVRAIQSSKFFILNRTVTYLKSVKGAMTDIRYQIIYEDLWDYFDTILTSRRHEGLGITFNDFCHGGSSGQCALQLAVLLGFKKIYLLGIDLTVQGGRTHFHSGYGRDKTFTQKLEKYRKSFITAIQEAKQKVPGLQIISCSSISKLNGLIPYIPIEQALGLEVK